MSNQQYRDNNRWLHELRGLDGNLARLAAFQALGNYLYVVAYNYLRRRQNDVFSLSTFAYEELAALGQDFVQDTLERIAADDCALLEKYHGSGAFTGWCSRLVTNAIASELRTSIWSKRNRPTGEANGILQTAAVEDRMAQELQIQQITDVLKHCIQRLPERRQIAFVHCMIHNRPAADVATQLDATANAVNQLVHHAKRDLRRCVESSGYGPDVLALFE